MRVLTVFLLWLACAAACAQALPGAAEPPSVSARAYYLLDYRSGRALAEKNADERIEPASLTKLMTTYVVFDAIRRGEISLAQRIRISDKAWRAPGSRMFVEPGSEVAVEDLLRGVIVQSGNDATIALAEGVAGSEEVFVERMNREAARMGLANSHFENATGLPSEHHHASAADLAAVAAAIIREFPQYFPLYALREYTYDNITQYNRNRLLGHDPYVDGMKTGFTESAGFCLVATAQRDGRRLISVVIDSDSDSGRAADAQKLLNYGFESFDTFKLYAKGQPLRDLPIWKGVRDTFQAGLNTDLYVTIPKGLAERLRATLESMQPLLAPIRAGDRVGKLLLSLDGRPYGEYAVVSLENISMASLMVRAWHSLRLLMN